MKARLFILVVAVVLALQIAALQIQTGHQSGLPVAFFTYTPRVPAPEETITFNASASYGSDGSIVQYRWNFGDGTISILTNPLVTHSYPVDGTYTVELTVTDNGGNTAKSTAVVEVSTVVFFRLVILGTLTPVSNVKVTTYYQSGSSWIKAPTGPGQSEIKYDNMTQPNLADNEAERFRNPGYTAVTLRSGASNIGFDIHPSGWNVYFKFEWGSYVAYWPNETTVVYNYKNGGVETHSYAPGHRGYWDASASKYVINVGDIHGNGVSPTESHPIIVGISSPPPVQKYTLNIGTSPAGVTTIPGAGEYLAGSNVNLTAPAPVVISPASQYRFDYWDVDSVSRGSGVNPIIVNMNANHTATAHYVTQYLVNFTQTGLESDAYGTVLTVNGTAKASTDLPYAFWVDSGQSVTYSYATPISSNIGGKHYKLSTVSGPVSPFIINSGATVCGNYVAQYLVTMGQTGVDSTATGTILVVNGTAKTYSDLPLNWWVDTGSVVVYSYNSLVSSSTTGKRFSLVTVDGPLEQFVVLAPNSITGEYCTQLKVTFLQTGLDSSAQGTVVTINGTLFSSSEVPFEDWVKSGSTLEYSYSNIVLSSTTNKQFQKTTVTGPTSPITVTGTTSVIGNYKIQYRVTFDKTGVGTDFAGTVATIDDISYDVGNLPVSFWFDKNSNHNFNYASPLVVNASIQHSWSSTTGISSLQSGTISIMGSGTITGNYLIGNAITFDSIGVSSSFTGTVLTLDGTAYSLSQLPISFIWQTGTTHDFSYASPLNVGINNTRYVWTSTSGLSTVQTGSIIVSSFGSIIGNYKTQYYLSLPANLPGLGWPSGSGWYDDGSYAFVSAQQYQPGGSRYRFDRWETADMSEIVDPYSPTTTILIDKPKTVTAYYVHQYLISFYQDGISSDAVGTILTVNSTSNTYTELPYSIWVDEGNEIDYAFESNVYNTLLGRRFNLANVTGPSSPIIANADVNVTGYYDVQYHLSVLSSFGTSGGEGWYKAGSDAYATLSTGIVDHGDGTRHVFTSWGSDASGTSYIQSNSISMNAPKTAIADWKIQYYLTLTTDPVSITSPTGEGWYDSGYSAPISAAAFINIVPGSSRYRFNGWTTNDMGEIADPTRSPTNVTMDNAKTVTANYAKQYFVTFGQNGLLGDFTGTIVTVDTRTYNFSSVPATFWWDDVSSHTFEFASPLTVNVSKRYDWSSSTGLSTVRSSTILVSGTGNVTGHYISLVTYMLTIQTSSGGSTNPVPNAYIEQAGATVPVGAIPSSGYMFDHWELDGVNKGQFTPYSVYMNGDHILRAFFRTIPAQLAITITPASSSIQLGQSVAFGSSASGGVSPYTYQWCLDAGPVSGATSSGWIFVPLTQGTYRVCLKVTDSASNQVQSLVATVVVTVTPVGGYSVLTSTKHPVSPTFFCIALLVLTLMGIVLVKRKRN